ncbi:MAG: hypothetical protein ABI988_13100 [Nitrospirota bacterium]
MARIAETPPFGKTGVIMARWSVRKFLSVTLAFELLFSEIDHNHSLGENIEKCLTDLDLMPGRRGVKKYTFSVQLPTLCLHGEGSEAMGVVSG